MASNFDIKKLYRYSLLSSCSLLLSACITPQKIEKPAPKPAPPKISKQQQQLNAVYLLRSTGELTDTQAAHIIASIKHKSLEVSTGQIKTRPYYTPKTTFTGRLRSMGSSTMGSLMEDWKNEFNKHHNSVNILHEQTGSATVMQALIEGRIDIGPMSRPLSRLESTTFNKKLSVPPMQIPVAVDCLAVYVHPSNPFAKTGFTMATLDSIFSTSLKRGRKERIETWGDLGLTGEWADQPIVIYGRNNTSGNYSIFRREVLLNGAFRSSINEISGDKEIIQRISSNKYAIGYGAIGNKTALVAAAPLAMNNPQNSYPPTKKYAYSGKYPLKRLLYLTLPATQTKESDLGREFARYVLSKEGQTAVSENGFYPVDTATSIKWLSKLKR